MNQARRIVLILYCLLLAYCFVWIPWSITSSDRYGTSHQRLGYGWVWAGPRHPTWTKPKQQGQYSVCDLDPPPGTQAQPDCSSVEDFESQQAERWDAVSRRARPDMTLVAFRFITISLIFAATLPLVWFRKNRPDSPARPS